MDKTPLTENNSVVKRFCFNFFFVLSTEDNFIHNHFTFRLHLDYIISNTKEKTSIYQIFLAIITVFLHSLTKCVLFIIFLYLRIEYWILVIFQLLLIILLLIQNKKRIA